MNAGLQQKIAPSAPSGARTFHEGPTTPVNNQENKIDFQKLLYNSNQDIKAKKDEAKKGDLSTTKDYKGFLENLNHRGQKAVTPKNSMGKDDFLKLFVAQLQHQDPLNPKDGSEMASQLAQFNSLEQMMNMNKALEHIDSGTKENRQVNLISYLGKDALIKNGLTRLEAGKIQEAYFELAHPVNDVELKVTNEQGTAIYTKSYGTLQAGKHPIEWDGSMDDGSKAKAGNYRLSVGTKDESGTLLPITVTSRVHVQGLALDKDHSQIASNAGKLTFEDIVALEERKVDVAKKDPLASPPDAKSAALPPASTQEPHETPSQSQAKFDR